MAIKIPTYNATRGALAVSAVSLGLRIAAARWPFLAPFAEELTGLAAFALGVAIPAQRVKAPS